MADKVEKVAMQAVYEVPLEVSAVLGIAEYKISDILKFTDGTVIELNKKVGEPIDICINGKVVARGEIMQVDDKIGITLTEIFQTKDEV